MELRIFTEPQQGASYRQLLAVARHSEDAGFAAFFRSDHFLSMGDHVDGLPGPSDAWITLAGIARETSRIRLGTLVNSATFRHPALLAIGVANVDDMSGGRVELGLGTGWYDAEHTAYGFAFPPLGERFDILEEQLAVVSGLWGTPAGSSFSHPGPRFPIVDSPALPKPVQSPPPIIVGGGGPRRTPALAARFAAEFNLPFRGIAAFGDQKTRVEDACRAIGRDPGSLAYSAAVTVAVGATAAEAERRAAAIGRDPVHLREYGLCGTPAEVIERIGQWSEAGASRLYLQVLDLDDLDHVDLIGAEVLPRV
ncbi:MAG: hypothetical protein RL330_184 [Actinomycetota bacterium]|jgi:F420-dependent oxidoreductase-like protein